MKQITYSVFGILLFCLLTVNAQAQKLVEDVNISSENATLQMVDQTPQSYLLEIGGPDNYYWKEEINDAKAISISTLKANGEKFSDGQYNLQVTPIIKFTTEQQSSLREARNKNDEAAIAAFRQANNLPALVEVYNINFSIRDGKFVSPDQKEARLSIPGISSSWVQDHPAQYASLNTIEMDYRKSVTASDGLTYATDNTSMSEDAQVIATDLIVQGSSCVGFDCVSSESFGFDTQRLKEDNLRINFNDTSNSASFPSNDWRLVANDTANGGANYFAIEDATAGRRPFTVEAGAPINSLYVEADGDVGIKTANPVVDLHIVEGNTPAIRLEQDGSDGFAAQTWDVSGNETNFFIRDVTNSSNLPFRIFSQSHDDALCLRNGKIGVNHDNPIATLHLRGGDGPTKLFIQDLSPTSANRTLMILENRGGNRIQFNNTDPADASEYTLGLNNKGILIMSRIGVSGTAFTVDAANNVGVKTTSPDFDFEVNGTAGKVGGGIWSTPSDRRLKTNIVDYTDGLDQLLKIRPVRYEFNGKHGLTTGTKFVGIIAQEMQKVAPYMIKDMTHIDDEGVKSDYLSYDGSALTYMLINSVKTQNDKIEKQAEEIKDLQAQLSKLEQLQKEVAELAKLVRESAKN